ncbi:hypothetical protein HanRHA438_Chr11g0497001 [Helianthus annuus]|nr:hypothetical protein HanRHA438_Chr11g0497001 [Helianthus annuus]
MIIKGMVHKIIIIPQRLHPSLHFSLSHFGSPITEPTTTFQHLHLLQHQVPFKASK